MVAVVGALRVDLGLDAIGFERGVAQAKRASSVLAQELERIERGYDRAMAGAVRSGAALSASGQAMQASVAAFAGVDSAARRAAESADAFAEALDARDAVTRLRASLDPAYAALHRYETQVEMVRRAVELGATSQTEASAVLALAKGRYDAATRGAAGLTASTARMGGAVRGSGFALQSASYQVGDFFVQVAAGTSAMRAASMQLPQLLGGFGVWGAIAGAAVAAGAALVPMLFDVGEGGQEAQDATEAFGASLDALEGYAATARMTIGELREEFGTYADEVLADAERLVRFTAEQVALQAGAAASPIREQLAEVEDAYQDFIDAAAGMAQQEAVFGPNAMQQAAVDEIERQFEAVAQAAGMTGTEFLALRGSLDALGGAAGQSLDVLLDRLTTTRDLLTAIYAGQEAPPEVRQEIDRLSAQINQLRSLLAAAEDGASGLGKALAAAASENAAVEAGLRNIGTWAVEAGRVSAVLAAMAENEKAAAVWMAKRALEFEQHWRAATQEAGAFRAAIDLLMNPIDTLGSKLAAALSPLQQAQGWLAGLASSFGGFMASFGPDSAMATTLAGLTDGAVAADRLIRQMENPRGPWLTPHMDYNTDGTPDQLRIGYSSDTITLASGEVIHGIAEGVRISLEDANRDLARRIAEGQAEIIGEIGADKWAQLLPAQQAVLSSLEYNFGSLPDSIAAAIREGATDDQVAAAIRSLSGSGTRRADEAALYQSATMGEFGNTAALAAQAEAERTAAEAAAEREAAAAAAAAAAEQEAQAAQAAVDAYEEYVGGSDAASAAAREYAQAQEVINAALEAGHIDQATATAQLAEAGEAYRAATEEVAAFDAALEQAGMTAAEMGTAKAGILIGGIEGISGAWGDFVASGFRDFEGFADAVLGSFRSMLAEMVALAARNQIMIQMGIGGVPTAPGLMGSVGDAFGSFLGGGFSVVSGLFTGGIEGAASAFSTALAGATSGLAGLATAIGAIAVPVAAAIGLFAAFRGTTETLAAGLRITIDDMEALVETFETTRTSRLFGLISSTSTDYDAAPSDIADPVQDAFDDIADNILGLAEALGIGAEAFDDFSTQITVNTEGMTDEEAAQAVADALAGVSDEMALMVLASEDLIDAGETATMALERIAAAVTVASDAFTAMGYDFLELFGTAPTTAPAAAKLGDDLWKAFGGAPTPEDMVQSAADIMAEIFGGVEAMAAGMDLYFRTFYSVEEQIAATQAQLLEGLAAANVDAIPETEAAFRALVDAAITAGDAALTATLMGLTPLWQSLEELEAQASAEAAAIAAEAEALQARIWELEGDTASLRAAELAALDPANRALQERIHALEDEAALTAEADALWRRYYEAVGDTAALREMERAEVDPLNLALYDMVTAAEDAAAALSEAQAAMEALDPEAFVSRFAYEQAQARAAANLPSAPGVVPFPAPVAPPPPPPTQAQGDAQLAELRALRAEVQALRTVTESYGLSIDTNTRGTRDQLRAWDDNGLPPEVAA